MDKHVNDYFRSFDNEMVIDNPETSSNIPSPWPFNNYSIIPTQRVVYEDKQSSKLYLRHDYYTNLKTLGFTYKEDPAITFDKVHHGSNADFSSNHQIVTRNNSYSNCVVFMSQSIEINDIVQLEFLSEAQGWAGHMRFGITIQAPQSVKTIPPNGMSFYAREDFWILSSGKLHNRNREDDYALNFESLKIGDSVALSIDNKGKMSFYKNGVHQGPAVSNLPKGNNYHAVIDVYGSAKSLKLSYLRHQTSLTERCLMLVYKKLSSRENVELLPLPFLLKERLRELF